MKSTKISCSSCGRNQDAVARLISSPGEAQQRSYICDECVGVCLSILNDGGLKFLGDICRMSFRMRLPRRIAGRSASIDEIKR
jgi:ATP-dependent protease Clp ATPase subunit